MTVSSTGNFLVTASHDKSIRLWEKTKEIVVLEEEREMVNKRLTETELNVYFSAVKIIMSSIVYSWSS